MAQSVSCGDLVPQLDRAANEDVGAETGTMDERTEKPRSREFFKMRAGLGEPSTHAFDGADA